MTTQISRQYLGLLPILITLFVTSFNSLSHYTFDSTHRHVNHGFVAKYEHNFLTDFSTAMRCIFNLRGLQEQCDFESPYRNSDPFTPFVFLSGQTSPIESVHDLHVLLPQATVTPKQSLISKLKQRDLLFACPEWISDKTAQPRRLASQNDNTDQCARVVNCPNEECAFIDTESTEEVIQPYSALTTPLQSTGHGLSSFADTDTDVNAQETRLSVSQSSSLVISVEGLPDEITQEQADKILEHAATAPNNHLTDSDLLNLINPNGQNMLGLGASVSAASGGVLGVFQVEPQIQGEQQVNIIHGTEQQLYEMLAQYAQNSHSHQNPLLFFLNLGNAHWTVFYLYSNSDGHFHYQYADSQQQGTQSLPHGVQESLNQANFYPTQDTSDFYHQGTETYDINNCLIYAVIHANIMLHGEQSIYSNREQRDILKHVVAARLLLDSINRNAASVVNEAEETASSSASVISSVTADEDEQRIRRIAAIVAQHRKEIEETWADDIPIQVRDRLGSDFVNLIRSLSPDKDSEELQTALCGDTKLCKILHAAWKNWDAVAHVDGFDDVVSGILAGGSYFLHLSPEVEIALDLALTLGVPALYYPTFREVVSRPCFDCSKFEPAMFQLMLSGYYTRIIAFFLHIAREGHFEQYNHQELISATLLTGVGQLAIAMLRTKDSVVAHRHVCDTLAKGEHQTQCEKHYRDTMAIITVAQYALATLSFGSTYCHWQYDMSASFCGDRAEKLRTFIGAVAGIVSIGFAFRERRLRSQIEVYQLIQKLTRIFLAEINPPQSRGDDSNDDSSEIRRLIAAKVKQHFPHAIHSPTAECYYFSKHKKKWTEEKFAYKAEWRGLKFVIKKVPHTRQTCMEARRLWRVWDYKWAYHPVSPILIE